MVVLLGRPVAFHIVGEHCPEVLHLLRDCRETQSRVPCAVNAEEDGACVSCSEDRGALHYECLTSER